MLKRRSDKIFAPEALLNEVAMAPVDWPTKTVDLDRSSSAEYRNRPFSGQVSIAELYHENSKLYPELLPTLLAFEQDPDKLRADFLQRQAAALVKVGGSILELKAPYGFLIREFPFSICSYAVEVTVVQDDIVAFQEPLTRSLQIIKQLSEAELDAMRRAVRLIAPLELPLFDGIYVFVSGNFPRNEILFGVRGYRRTLIEAGQLAETVMIRATQLGLTSCPIYDFADRLLDSVLDLDGTEQSVLVAFEIQGRK